MSDIWQVSTNCSITVIIALLMFRSLLTCIIIINSEMKCVRVTADAILPIKLILNHHKHKKKHHCMQQQQNTRLYQFPRANIECINESIIALHGWACWFDFWLCDYLVVYTVITWLTYVIFHDYWNYLKIQGCIFDFLIIFLLKKKLLSISILYNFNPIMLVSAIHTNTFLFIKQHDIIH